MFSWPDGVDLAKCVGFSVPWLDKNLAIQDLGCNSTMNDGLIFSQLEKNTEDNQNKNFTIIFLSNVNSQ